MLRAQPWRPSPAQSELRDTRPLMESATTIEGTQPPVITRAGRARGLNLLPPGVALRPGVLIGWTTAAAALRGPAQRPVGALWMGVTVAWGGFGWNLKGSGAAESIPAAVKVLAQGVCPCRLGPRSSSV